MIWADDVNRGLPRNLNDRIAYLEEKDQEELMERISREYDEIYGEEEGEEEW